MDAKFIAFYAACMISLWVLGRSDDPPIEQEKNSPHAEKTRTEKGSLLDDLYRLEG